jgi:FkbM family methyltransferase
MIHVLERVCEGMIFRIARFFGNTPLVRSIFDLIGAAAFSRQMRLVHNGHELVFATPNSLNRFRVRTFSLKEPETLVWIDEFNRGDVLWDIGANIGLYTCYAAKARGCVVVSFEPSIFNLEILGRNIFANKLQQLVTIIPLPLSKETRVDHLSLSNVSWGGAMSTFKENYGHDGRRLPVVFSYQTVSVAIDESIEKLKLEKPTHVKIDVDGIEHLILIGGIKTLESVESVLVEINEEFLEQKGKAEKVLSDSGLHFVEKHPLEDSSAGSCLLFNQLWKR